ncbi:PDZ domain-containing protein [Pseudoflavonifractor sp. 60]|uniref:S1C family serine protease n=1 Tax=Pseudoflavonifractor sp. 60 TaxID=2304576 RepID=UPI00136E3FF5|nr:trypsin-like peptidase domain-containing protein [Pseudoflavonifractor sp. 60]NBI67769.1 PDZ domain-containing protein [Pseudoflavonifractor sp. 60]
MEEFNFYNSENDGYRGSFGGYVDPEPTPPPTPFQTGGQPPRKKKSGAARAVALVLACALVGGSAGVGGAYLYNRTAGANNTTTIYEENRPQIQTVVNTNSGQPMTPEQLYAANLASCVGITVNTTVNVWGQTTTSAASGSGFVLSRDGYIATNYHVIEEAVDKSDVAIEVSFANGDKYNAKLVGGEKDNDVAVLKIEVTGLTPVTLGDSSKLVVGEAVYAIGNPLGELTYSFTDGIVSALDRLISTTSTNANGQRETTTLNVLQTNCVINPGNSGGPLFDSYGNVIGITTAKYTQSSSGVNVEGLGFALPINDVKEIFADLIAHGYVTGKPYMGVRVDSVSSEAQRYGISAGAVIVSVADGSCAQKAGLQPNDIITAIDDTAIDSSTALTAALSTSYKAGDTATLTVIRSQEELKLTITFDEKNAETEANNQAQQQEEEQQPSQNYGDSNQGNGYYYQWPFGNLFPW